MITLPQLPKVPAFASLPSFDFSSLQLPKVELPKVELPKFELPKLDLAKVGLPKVEVPAFLSEVEVPRFEDVATKAAGAVRDGSYAVLGLGVVATQQLLKAAKQATEKAGAALQRD